MDSTVAAILTQDGIANGAVYAMLALALVLVFSVTRILFVAQGEFVAYGALTLASLEAGAMPKSVYVLMALGALVFLLDAWASARQPAGNRLGDIVRSAVWNLGLPLLVFLVAQAFTQTELPTIARMLLAMLIVVPMGPYIYRLAFQPVSTASTLVLLIIAVGVHFALVGIGLWMFGAEGARTTALTSAVFDVSGVMLTGQSLAVIAVAAACMVALSLFFTRTVPGKALRATAMNPLGALLVGVGAARAGQVAFALAAAMGCLCGVLLAPLTTMYYDSGFLVGLKGFVGAIVGGLVSFPLAAAGAVLVGVLESYASFFASAFKDVLVFGLIVPVLLWRSLTSHASHEEEE